MAGVRLRAKPCFASACLTHAGSSAASMPRTVPRCPGHRLLDTWLALEARPIEVAICHLAKGDDRRAGGAESRPWVSQGGLRGTAARLGERPARCAGPVRAANESAARLKDTTSSGGRSTPSPSGGGSCRGRSRSRYPRKREKNLFGVVQQPNGWSSETTGFGGHGKTCGSVPPKPAWSVGPAVPGPQAAADQGQSGSSCHAVPACAPLLENAAWKN
ncbi:hypothetical protein SAMN06296416_102345 [Pseudoxanthomonas wuyuanensis]|uniref:Uncharacterized protein n=1 Tax=Pseudoxanthomonas wuyuanensis TaxID=1073196 RepID=A0A286D3T8_9GAMM|nr:hypothetical protein SAMN06296416_102345 [Pseudoxanthomonas wuyuanensis]